MTKRTPSGALRRSPVQVQERGVGRAAQPTVQLVQFAALALPADPPALALVPHAPAVQQEETVAARRRRVSRVETGDPVNGRPQQGLVALDRLRRSVGPVRQQGELNVARTAGQVVDFQQRDLRRHGLARRQQRRYDHERPQMLGHAVAKLESRQQACAEAVGHALVDQRNRRVQGRDRAKSSQHPQPDPARAGLGVEDDRQG
jgi:hypothetical protein